jgi:hypothetical protein
MSLNTSNTSMTVGEMPTYTLPKDASGNETDILSTKRDQHNYEMYQQQYKKPLAFIPSWTN